MISKNELIKNKDLLNDKAIGAFIGHAIGDSFGDSARSQENHFNYGITMDFDENEVPSTDDTDFALLTAQILLECKGDLTTEKVVEGWKKYVSPNKELKRGGASEIEGMANIRRGIMPPLSGKYNAYNISDGASMRVTAFGIACAGDPGKAARYAEIDASLSHWRDGIWGAQAVAAAVSVAMINAPVEEIINTALKYMPEDSWLRYNMLKAIEIIKISDSMEEAWMPLHKQLWSTYKAAVPEAVVEAFSVIMLTKGDFKKGIIYGGNFGRDADTIGAIVGAVSGALNGASAIPEKWKEKTRYPAGICLPFTKGLDVYSVASELAKLAELQN
jgi:ADP-ribosylglycohydrolase